MAAIVVAAFLLRLAYLHQIHTIPFYDSLVGDARAYDQWADRIAKGDWWGQEVFYQAPLYPYFLAVVKVAFGPDPGSPCHVQAALGALCCGLIGLAAWLFFSRQAALWAAGILAVYPPAIFFDGLIQKTSLGQFLECALLAWIAWTMLRPVWWKLACAGVSLGLYGLTRENTLALVPILAVWIWLAFHRQPRAHRARWLGSYLAGLAIILVPVGLRNQAVGGQFVLTTSQAGPNFYIGNNPDATGRYVPLVRGHETPEFERDDATRLAESALGRELSAAQVSRYWLDQSVRFISEQPGAFVMLLARKWMLVWNAYEIPDAESFYVYAEWSWLLGTLHGIMHFGVLVPLAAAGVCLTWHQRRRVWPLYAVGLTLAVAVALFYVFARYRYPLVPVLTVFAGAAISMAWNALKTRRYRVLAIAAGAVAVSALVSNLRMNPEAELDAMAWGNLGGAFAQRGEVGRAIPLFERAAAGAPDQPEPHFNLGMAYSMTGQTAKAIRAFRRALQLEPNLAEADFYLALALERLGERETALHHYRRALERNPGDADAQRAVDRLTIGKSSLNK